MDITEVDRAIRSASPAQRLQVLLLVEDYIAVDKAAAERAARREGRSRAVRCPLTTIAGPCTLDEHAPAQPVCAGPGLGPWSDAVMTATG